MRHPSLKLLMVAVLSLGTMGLVANQVFASVPTVKGKGKVFTELNFTVSLTSGEFVATVVNVPDKETAVVTDVIISNTSAGTGNVSLRCTQGVTPVTIMAPVVLTTDTSFSHSFGQGLICPAGTNVAIVLEGAATAVGWTVTVTGYLRKGS